MKVYLRKIGYSLLVFANLLTMVVTINTEVVYANDEETSTFQNSSKNSELNNEEAKFEEVNNNNSTKTEAFEDVENIKEADELKDSEEDEKNGWFEENNEKFYYEEGKQVTGWKEIEGKQHYFDDSGVLLKDTIIDINNEKYRLDGSGVKFTGWYKDSVDIWYYYSSETGVMATDWQKVDGKWYYLHTDGSMATGWKKINNKWYYLRASGSMVTGSYKINERSHAFSSSGVWQGSWRKNNIGWWFKEADGSYPANQWKLITDKWYYFNNSGYMSTGWQKVNNTWYYLNPGGSMATGWKQLNSKWYYLRPSGSMVTGSYKINDRTYVFSSSGAWQGSWRENSTGWWFKEAEGSYPANQWKYLNDKWYRFDSSGYMSTGWQKINNKWYYLNPGGSMATGWKKVNKKWYYLYSSGAMAANTMIGQYRVGSDGAWIEQITVYLDPGHGSSDTGAYYGGIAERDINLQVSNKVAVHLKNAGYNVIMSRDSKENSYSSNSRTDLFSRAEKANELGVDIFVSVHHNALPWNSGVAGIETYYYGVAASYPPLPGNKDSHNDPARIASSRILANSIHKELINSTNAEDRGVLQGAFVVVRETKMPAVLLELGYMSNSNELKKLTTDSYQNTLADSIFKGINAYFGN